MANYKIRCEVVQVLSNKFNCSKVGDTFVLGPRTPAGMCARAFATAYPASLAMRFSESTSWETETGTMDIICPDQDIVYRLSRIRED